MIWTDLIEEFPEDGYIHPLHEGKGHDGRKYRPVWHAVESTKNMDYNIVTDGGEELESAIQRGHADPDRAIEQLHDGCVIHLDGFWGKDRFRYRSRDDTYERYGKDRDEYPNAYTTCTEEHVREAVANHGVWQVRQQ